MLTSSGTLGVCIFLITYHVRVEFCTNCLHITTSDIEKKEMWYMLHTFRRFISVKFYKVKSLKKICKNFALNIASAGANFVETKLAVPFYSVASSNQIVAPSGTGSSDPTSVILTAQKAIH